MADPLSITASVAGLVSLGVSTIDYLFKYYDQYKNRDATLAHITDRLQSLLTCLRAIENVIQTRKWRGSEKDILNEVENSISNCRTIIGELEREVDKFKVEPQDGFRKTIKLAGRKAAYPIRQSTLVKLGEDIDEFQDNLSIAMEALQLQTQQDMQIDLEDIKAVVTVIHAQNVTNQLRLWLNAPDTTVDYSTASAKRHADTGSWFVRGSQFATWLQQDNSFLWLHGFAGCGKSVLCSTAIQHAYRHHQSISGSAIAFFFFTFNDQTKQDAASMLRAVLYQLCGQIAGVETDLAHLRGSYNAGTPPVTVLIEHLRQAISRAQHVYILIDALDECPKDGNHRRTVLSTIQTMRSWSLAGLHLLVTSRALVDIQQALNVEAAHAVELTNDAIGQDIRRFVSYEVDHDPDLVRWGRRRELIKQRLSDRAQGVYGPSV